MKLFLAAGLLAGAAASSLAELDISADVAYLHAIASVHEFCELDFSLLCGGADAPEEILIVEEDEAPRRRLSEMMVSITALIEVDDQITTAPRPAAPLGLGAAGDSCLRKNAKRLSQACASSVALADATAVGSPAQSLFAGVDPDDDDVHDGHPPYHRRRCGGLFALILVAAMAFALCRAAARTQRRQRLVRTIVRAIKHDALLRAHVEKVTGLALFEAPGVSARRANGGGNKFSCCRFVLTTLSALLCGYALAVILGPALAMAFVWLVVVPAVLVSRCVFGGRAQRNPSTTTAVVRVVGGPSPTAAGDDACECGTCECPPADSSYVPPVLPAAEDPAAPEKVVVALEEDDAAATKDAAQATPALLV
eukprot:CAMPEP_0185697104 /NCGR_PEP_ID=MMETSP1164-20130828/5540_1 /TAXON_ID=1104430 /ORGANISM="Chrysoreinhardia sp, Strain CCMP2950" /LENGTH=366 /DNA_ID=CAMNT_0028363997 /DNA_START=34 /DNA_END=1134 /DNA_ORIENTATION=-